MRIIVLGYIVRGPLGGLAWHHLQYVLGLARLGHDVFFLEDSEDYPQCYDPRTRLMSDDPSYGLGFAADAFTRLGIGERWAYYEAPKRAWTGPAAALAPELCRTAEVLINVSGVNPVRPWMENIPVRVLIDTDPFFVQVRHTRDLAARALAQQHNAFFSFGENTQALRALIDDGLAWRATRQPVVLDCWPWAAPPPQGAFTTVMHWDSYPPVVIGGRSFGMKSHTFPAVLELPRRVDQLFELAIGGPAPELESSGWRLRDAADVTRTPWTYRDYIGGSLAEFTVAKEGYVASACGWFSERSANYMASGRPVLVQQTGFSTWLPTGRGALAFTNLDEAVAGAQEILSSPERHGRWARELADTYFGSAGVLTRLLEESCACAGPGATGASAPGISRKPGGPVAAN